MSDGVVIHNGGCHCRHVRWQAEAATSVMGLECNCSICSMKGNTNAPFFVPSAKFKLLGDSDQYLTTYTFGTHTAKHTFCKVCGITSFYMPRSIRDQIALKVKCMDHGTLAHVEIRNFDGKKWEIPNHQGPEVSSFVSSDQCLQNTRMSNGVVVHKGGCHCRRVRWQAEATTSIVAWECNCSDCSMRGNVNFIIPSSKFKLLGDSDRYLTTYTFGTHTAKHIFCKVCGITSFYVPRSNPDGVALTVKCVDPGTLTHVEIKSYDGKDWESSYRRSSIASCSISGNQEPQNTSL